jgi:hypothetical protein
MGLLQYLSVRSSDRQDKPLCYVVSVGSILNQSRLYKLGHQDSDFFVIEFFFRATRSPVDVPTVLQLSCGYSGYPSAARGPVLNRLCRRQRRLPFIGYLAQSVPERVLAPQRGLLLRASFIDVCSYLIFWIVRELKRINFKIVRAQSHM